MGLSYLALMMWAALIATATPVPVANTAASGTLIEVAGEPPILIVLTTTKLVKIPVARGAAVVRNPADSLPAAVASISDLEPGDYVSATLDSSGTATTVKASYRLVSGEVRSINGTRVLLASGELIEMNPSARILGVGNEPIPLAAITRGDSVIIKTDPHTDEGWRLALGIQETAAGPSERPSITSITHDAEELLQPGRIVHLKIIGAPGCEAVCEINKSKLELTETSPGVYQGIWTAPTGKGISKAAVVGTLSQGDLRSKKVQAGRLISVAAGESQMGLEQKAVSQPDGPQVTPPEVRPEAGQPSSVQPALKPAPSLIVRPAEALSIEILRPKPGEQLADYFIITGKTAAGAKVRTSIEYTNNLTGILNLSGRVAEEEVAADAKGEFSSSYIRLSRALSSRGLEFTITAVALDHGGRESRPAVVRALGRGF